MPVFHLLAGPNGAGKSSYAEDVLIPATRLSLINADRIAAELWPDSAEVHAYEAAAIAEGRRRDNLTNGISFISETVFSHPSKVRLVADAVRAGYLVHLHVIMIPVELAVLRVSERIARGGHSVPEVKIRDRYRRLFDHIAEAVKIADRAEVFDNSKANVPFSRCASFQYGTLIGEADWPNWTPEPLKQI